MNVMGIVCEYNPFHNGHLYHMAKSREAAGSDASIICVMSGDFVQRGEPAIYSKFARAEAACRCGADLVIELPLPWCLASAEGFARGAVGILAALGVRNICFGSEAGEVDILCRIAEILTDGEVNEDIKNLMLQDGSLPYAKARQMALETRIGEAAQLLAQPNNILAIEYIKAIKTLDLDMEPVTVQRFGSEHDGVFGEEGHRSASEIRRMLRQGIDAETFIPPAAAQIYTREQMCGRQVDSGSMETAILSRLRMIDADSFNALPDGGEGLGSRLFRAARSEPSLDAVLSAAKSKRYALSRIRRMCLNACLGISAGMSEGLPPYARVLAANSEGRRILREGSKSFAVPVLTKPAAVKEQSESCNNIFGLGAAAHDFYALAYTSVEERRGGGDWRRGPVIIE